MRNARYRNGFTLIEVLFATILIGIAIACLVASNISSTKANSYGTNLSTAEFLIEQIRELTTLLPVTDPNTGIATFGPESGEILSDYDDLDDFDGTNISPPISADREVLSDFAAFAQQVTVENVSESDFEQVVGDHGSYFVRVTVAVSLHSEQISSVSWIRAQY
ncbi:MAG: type II secretion system protein [Planctomycetota bacterium]|jgi:prepilin-type N-terminal cleavage/methylation domain-containing protein